MANIPVAPAIGNAIANEIGDRIYNLPDHREHVFMILQKRRHDES